MVLSMFSNEAGALELLKYGSDPFAPNREGLGALFSASDSLRQIILGVFSGSAALTMCSLLFQTENQQTLRPSKHATKRM